MQVQADPTSIGRSGPSGMSAENATPQSFEDVDDIYSIFNK